MKKILLSILAISLSAGSFAQQKRNANFRRPFIKEAEEAPVLLNQPITSSASNVVKPVISYKNGQNPHNAAVVVTAVGQSSNANGPSSGSKTNIFAHPAVNSVVMVYRHNPATGSASSGDMDYAISTNGGASWIVDEDSLYISDSANFSPPFCPMRYPNGAIYNPTGNTDPNNAFIFYEAPDISGSNGGAGYGGVVHGAMSMLAGSKSNKNEILTDFTWVPTSLTIAPTTNKSYFLDQMFHNVGNAPYIDSVALFIGTWNTTTKHYDYVVNPVYAPVDTDDTGLQNLYGPGNIDQGGNRIAFAPNSNTGFMTMLGNPGFQYLPDSVFSVMIYKTIDGGLSWSSLGVLDLSAVSAALPAATDYNVWEEQDLVVDINGNAHLVLAIGSSDNDWSFDETSGKWGLFDIYSVGGGTSWKAQLLAKPNGFKYTIGSTIVPALTTAQKLEEFSRPQASTNWSGSKVFFTWFDTDPGWATDNSQPDAFVMGYDVALGNWTLPTNVTVGNTDVERLMFLACVSPYVFENAGTYTIPMSFVTMSVYDNPTKASTHNYVDGITMADADFTVTGTPTSLALISTTGIKDHNLTSVKSVLVYPNPASGRNNTLSFAMDKSARVTVELMNALGQTAKTIEYGVLNAGQQKLNLDVSNLQAGIYIVKVKVGDDSAVQKITVK